MTAAYPASIITTFTTHQNNVDLIDSSHPNVIQDEVLAIETTLGTIPSTSGKFGIKTGSTFLPINTTGTSNPDITSYIYAGLTTFGTVSDRVTNVEGLAYLAYTTASTVPAITTQGNATQLAAENLYKINVMGGF